MMGLGPRAVFCASRVRHLLAACILVGAALSSASTAPVANTSEDSLKVIATVTVGSGPQGLAVPNPPIYLAKIDVASQTIVEPQFALIKNGISAAIAISPDSAILYIPEFEKDVLALSATTGQLEKKIVIFTGIGNHSKYYLEGAAISRWTGLVCNRDRSARDYDS
jgi:hypothetical protein